MNASKTASARTLGSEVFERPMREARAGCRQAKLEVRDRLPFALQQRVSTFDCFHRGNRATLRRAQRPMQRL